MARISAEQRRRDLIEAAFRVMAREGVAAATTRAIAAEAGAPLATFHYCFRSKEELLRELTPALVERMLERAVAGVRPGRELDEMLREGIHSIWSVIEATPGEQHALFELTLYALRNPGMEDEARSQYGRYYETARDYLRDVADAAGAEWTVPLPVVARMLVSLFDGLSLGWIVDRNGDEVRCALDAFAAGLARLSRPCSDAARAHARSEAGATTTS